MIKKTLVVLVAILFLHTSMVGQEETWGYVTAKEVGTEFPFNSENGFLKYTGTDARLKTIFDAYKISDFKKTLKKNTYKNRDRVFFLRANSKQIIDDLVATQYFVAGREITGDEKKIYEPNDYGLTSTIGENLGFPVELDYFDYLNLPQAWYYTTGSRDVIIGISDGSVDTINPDFKGKTKVIQKSHLAKGHGISISGNAAAQGDNGYGVPGVCYDCSIYGTNYGDFYKVRMLNELSKLNAKVINCSWAGNTFRETAQVVIDSIYNRGTLVVASSGNRDWSQTKGERLNYPASFDNVISVSSGMYRNEGVTGHVETEEGNGKYFVKNIAGYVGRTVGFKDNDTLNEPHIYPVSTANLNPMVDLLAPTAGLFSFGEKIINDTIWYSRFETTSGASPLVSGTIGLMYALNPKLPHDEVESILKITSTNIDSIPANKPYAGMYGAGMLNTGKAVKMVYDLYTENATSTISDQDFTRWNFKISAYSNRVLLKNQRFRKEAQLKLRARNQVVLSTNTHLKPDTNGSISIKIDPSMKKEGELQLRDPSILDRN